MLKALTGYNGYCGRVDRTLASVTLIVAVSCTGSVSVAQKPTGVEIANQLCADGFTQGEFFFDGTWAGTSIIPNTDPNETANANSQIHPAAINQGGFGQSVSMGDFNGDGIDDFLVASASFDADLEEMFGDSGSPGLPDWRFINCLHDDTDSQDPHDDLGLETGWGFTAIIYGKALGYDVQTTGESLSNVGPGGTITVAPSLNPWSAGNEFLMPEVLDDRDANACAIADQPNGVYFVGGSLFGYLAYGASAGDFDVDTYLDVVLGHSRYDNTVGRAYVVFGRNGGLPNSPHADNPSAWLMTTNGFVHTNGTQWGYDPQYWIDLEIGPATAEDFHQWGPGVNNEMGNASQVNDEITMCQHPGPAHESDPDVPDSISKIGLNGGWAVWCAGDVDGDGYSDLLIGAPNEDIILEGNATMCFAPRGRTSLVYGYDVPKNATGSNGGAQCQNPQNISGVSNGYTLDLDDGTATWTGSSGTTSPTDIATFRGEHNGDHAGYAVSSAGDVNGDGFADFLIGADWADHPCGAVAGESCLHSPCHQPFCDYGTPGHNIRLAGF